MNLNRDKRLLFYQLFKPFAIFVLAVALLACVFMYSYALHNAYEELDNQLSGTIQSAANLIDTQFEEMGRIVYRLELEEDIRPYHVFQNAFVHRYASDTLSSYVCANSYLDDVLVYYGDSIAKTYNEDAIFLSRFGLRDVKTLWNYEYRFTDLSYEELKVLIEAGGGTTIIPDVQNRNVHNLAGKHALYIVSSSRDRAVIFLLDVAEIGKHLESQLAYLQGNLSVWDQKGQNCILNFGSETQESPLHADIIPVKDEVTSTKLDNGILRTTYSASGSPFVYVIDWHNNPYWSSMRATLAMQTLFFLAAIIGGVLLAFSVSSHVFKPIGQTYDFVTTHARPLSISFDGMMSSLREIESQWEQMKYQMYRQRELCRLQIIGSILYGDKMDEQQIHDLLLNNGIELCGAQYDVCVVELEHMTDAGSEIGREFSKYLEECAPIDGEKRFAIPLNERNTFACICVFEEKRNKNMPFTHFFAALKEGLNQDVIVTMGVGNSVDQLSGIAVSFNEARNALQHAFLLGRNRMIRIDEVHEADSNELIWYPVQLEEWLTRGLMVGDADIVREKLQELEAMLKGAHAFINVSRSIMTGILRRLADALHSEGNFQAQAELVHISSLISNTNITLEEVIAQMGAVLEEACKAVKPMSAEKESFSDKVDAYLRMSMANCQLALPDIADAFGMSVGHFSRLYKQDTNITAMQKLDEIRLDAAEKLIRETDMRLDAILSQCGYNDKGNFIRKFKRQYSVPPMRYREIHRIENIGNGV